ncbi:MAG: alpha/beta hydrolase [Clostridiales bacterium]|nr:alpha/beta hydrolase [Clostridiales bacterium]
MKTYTVDLQKEYGLKGGKVDCYLVDYPGDVREQFPDWKRPAVIVVPGGGYGMVSKREAEPVALNFLARGFHAFVLYYTVGGENGLPYPEQLIELGATVDYVKKHADEFEINKDEVFAVGFSAGGHLTANLAVEYKTVGEKAGQPLDCKPTAVGLSYPVISKIHGHQGSYENLLYGYSDEAKAELLKTLNLDEAVDETTAPAFIWTTAKDTCVPPDNALRFALALDKYGIDYELHVYPRCNHGKSTGDLEINYYTGENGTIDDHRKIAQWLENCASFFRMYCKEKI